MEPITWRIYNDAHAPITGGSPTLKIKRVSDGYFLDWDDMTFKNAGWVTIAATLSELDAVNDKGAYGLTLDESGFADGVYDALTDYSAGGVVRTGDNRFEVQMGKVVGDSALQEVVEGSLSLEGVVRVALAVLAGKSAGGGTPTITFRNNADTVTRVTATVDASGNRVATTLNTGD